MVFQKKGAKPHPKPLYEVKDGALICRPHPGQLKALNSLMRIIAVLAGTQSGKCVSSGTEITLSSGKQVKIEDVPIGSNVLSMDDSYKLTGSKVLDNIDCGILDVYRLTTASGNVIEATGDHKFYDGYDWVPLKELAVKDVIACPRAIMDTQCDSDIFYDPIKSIEPTGKHQCYDLEVEDSHNYIANDVVSHNSTLAPLWMYNEMIDWDKKVQAGKAVLDAAFMVVSTTHALLERKLAPIYIDFFVNTLHIGEYHVQAKRLDVRIDREDGTKVTYQIFFGSAKNDESLASVTAAAMHLDEAGQQFFSRAAWHELEDRTGSTGGRILITTTIYNFDWLYDEVYLPAMAGAEDIEIIHFDSIDNPYYSRELWDKHKRTLPPALFDQRHRGRYTRSEGQIYDIFDPDIHVIKQFAIPPGTPIECGIDPGITNHCTLLMAKFMPGTQIFEKKFPNAVGDAPVYIVFDVDITGSTGTTMTNREHAKQLKLRPDYYDIEAIAGGAKAEIYFRADYEAEGVVVHKPMTSEVDAGIESVYQLFMENRLYIMSNLDDMLSEVRSYSRDIDDRGNTLLTIHNKSTYHMLDALRYICLYTNGVRTQAPSIPYARSGTNAYL